jgi:hypothetical protein
LVRPRTSGHEHAQACRLPSAVPARDRLHTSSGYVLGVAAGILVADFATTFVVVLILAAGSGCGE